MQNVYCNHKWIMIEYCQFKALKGQSTREYNGTCPVLLINSIKKCKDSFENKKEWPKMRDLNLLRELTQLWGVAGYEKPKRHVRKKVWKIGHRNRPYSRPCRLRFPDVYKRQDNKAISVFCFVSDLDNWCYFGTTQNSTQQQHLGGDIDVYKRQHTLPSYTNTKWGATICLQQTQRSEHTNTEQCKFLSLIHI